MQAFAETSAPLRLQSTDVWTPPYSCTPEQAHYTDYVPAILHHPIFSPTHRQVDNPMDPPIAPEIISEATGVPLLRQVAAENNRIEKLLTSFTGTYL